MTDRSILDVPGFNASVMLNRIVTKTQSCNGCLLWTGTKSDTGYGAITLKGKRFKAHRALYEILNGRAEGHLDVMHTCDNPLCVRPGHLKLGTHRENMRDMIAKGRGPIGENNAHAILTEDSARAIVECRRGGMSGQEIAIKFNVSEATVSSVCNGTRWQHLKLDKIHSSCNPAGETHGMAKLTEQIVKVMRERASHGESYASISRDFGVIPETVSLIVRRKTWKNVK